MALVDEPDPYEILQVHPKASPTVIKKAYRALMLELGAHPDAGGDAGLAASISQAYALLMDPEKRADYDQKHHQKAAHQAPESPSVVVPCASCGRRNRVRQLERLAHARCNACGHALVGPGAKVEGEVPSGPAAPGAPPVAPQAWGLSVGQAVLESMQALWVVGGEGIQALARPLGPKAAAWLQALSRPRLLQEGGLKLNGCLAKRALGAMGLVAVLGVLAWWWLQPPSLEQSLAAAQAALMRGDKAAQGRVLEDAWRMHPDDARLATALGHWRLDAGDVEGAIAPLREALMRRPEDAALLTSLGDMLLVTGRKDEAELRYRASLRLDPNQSDARSGLASVLAERGRWAEASLELKEAIRLRPDPAHWDAIAGFWMGTGKLHEASVAVEEVLKLDPKRRMARVRAATLALNMGDRNRAVGHLQALGGEPTNAGEAVKIAEAWGRLGRHKEAREAWRKALQQPTLGPLARERGTAYLASPTP